MLDSEFLKPPKKERVMKRWVLWIAFCCFTFSCDRYPDPEVKLLKNYSFYFNINQGQRFFAGEWVSDSVGFSVINNKAYLKDSAKVLFEVVKGGGQVTVSSTYTNKNGVAYTGWKLGSESFVQTLRANTYDLSGNFINSSDLAVYGFRTNEWDTLTNAPEAGITGMAADTVNKITLMIKNGSLYTQGERYYIWEQVQGPSILSSLNDIEVDRNQVFYVSTWDGNLLKSTDHGSSWEACTRPYPEGTYNVQMSISNDNSLWVNSFNNHIRYSKDQGETWIDCGIGFSFYGYGNVFKLKDGSLLLQGESCCSIFRSFDDGLTWNEITTPGRPVKLYVNDKDEIFIVSQQGSMYIYKSTDYGATFSYLYAVSYEWSSNMENIFNKVGNLYYVLIPSWGILKSTDLTHYDIFWINSNLSNLFIDHNGVMIGKYWNWQTQNQNTVYYRKNSGK